MELNGNSILVDVDTMFKNTSIHQMVYTVIHHDRYGVEHTILVDVDIMLKNTSIHQNGLHGNSS